MRWSFVATVAIGCGPVAGGPGDDDSDSGGANGTVASNTGETDGTGSATSGATTGTAGVTSDASATAADSSDDDPALKYDVALLDFGPPPPGPVDLGMPQDICELPMADNADLVGTGDFASLSLHAAAFARSGGGKCPFWLDVAVAADVAALTAWAQSGTMPEGSLLISLEVADDLAPGTWDADVVVVPGGYFFDAATVEVSAVTMLDVAEPMLEGTLAFETPEGSITGTFSARYCDLLEGGGCGA